MSRNSAASTTLTPCFRTPSVASGVNAVHDRSGVNAVHDRSGVNIARRYAACVKCASAVSTNGPASAPKMGP